MKNNVIFEGSNAIIDSLTFDYFKSIDRLVNSKKDKTGAWFLLRNGYAYKIIIED